MRSDATLTLRLLALSLWLLLVLGARAACCDAAATEAASGAEATVAALDGSCRTPAGEATSACGRTDPDPRQDCCPSDRSGDNDTADPDCPCCESGQCAQQAHRCCSCSGHGVAGSGLLLSAARWPNPSSCRNLTFSESLGPAAAHQGALDHPPRS